MEILTNGPKNGRKYPIITIKALGKVVDSWEVPKYQAIKYCESHPDGKHGKRFAEAVRIAKEKDKWLEEMEKKNES